MGMRKRDIHYHCLSSYLYMVFTMNTQFQVTHHVWEFTINKNEYKVSFFHPWLNKQGWWQPQELHSVRTKTALNAERRQFHLRTTNYQRTLLIHYYLCYFPVLANGLCWKWWHRWNDRTTQSSFFFQSYLLIS